MHFEILVEDISGAKALNILVPKIINTDDTFKIHPYKGIGKIPKNLTGTSDAQKRILLDRLPKLLRGYGKTYPRGSEDFPVTIILVCDLDNKKLEDFLKELNIILTSCDPQPETRFCIAIEEIEAWYLGDITAIKKHYTNAKMAIMNTYINDSICGTWEKLADAIYPGGSQKLTTTGYQEIGREKLLWAENITPHMEININKSPSFCFFRDKLLELTKN